MIEAIEKKLGANEAESLEEAIAVASGAQGVVGSKRPAPTPSSDLDSNAQEQSAKGPNAN